MNLETWHVTEDSPTRGEEEGGAGWEARKHSKSQTTAQQLEGKWEECVYELRNVARHKQGLTDWKGGRGRSAFVSSETWHVTNEDSQTGCMGVG